MPSSQGLRNTTLAVAVAVFAAGLLIFVVGGGDGPLRGGPDERDAHSVDAGDAALDDATAGDAAADSDRHDGDRHDSDTSAGPDADVDGDAAGDLDGDAAGDLDGDAAGDLDGDAAGDLDGEPAGPDGSGSIDPSDGGDEIDGPGQAAPGIEDGDLARAETPPTPDYDPSDNYGLMPEEDPAELGLGSDAAPNPALPDQVPIDIPGSFTTDQWVNPGIDPNTKVWIVAYDYGGSFEQGCAAIETATQDAGFTPSQVDCGPDGTDIRASGNLGQLLIRGEADSGGVLVELTVST